MRERGQGRRFPALGKAAGEIGIALLGAERVARRMAAAAMAEALDEIGAAVPLLGFGGIGLEFARPVEQRIPARKQRAEVEREGERIRRRRGAHRRLGHQVGVERLHVGVAGLGEMGVGEGGIELPSVAMQPVAHRALEGGIGPGADAGLDVGRDVG